MYAMTNRGSDTRLDAACDLSDPLSPSVKHELRLEGERRQNERALEVVGKR